MKKTILSILIIIILILTGCMAPKNQVGKIEKKDKAPDTLGDLSKSLQDILSNTETIEKILDGTFIEEEKSKKEKEEDSSEKGKEDSSKKEEGTSDEKKGSKESEGSQDSSAKEEVIEIKIPKTNEEIKLEEEAKKLLSTWIEIDKKIEEMHKLWNQYELDGMKKGMTTEKSKKFGESLNLLTKAIENRDIIEIYHSGSLTALNLGNIFELYRDEIKGEINKIKYATYESYIMAIGNKEKKAIDLLGNLEDIINRIRIKIEKDEEKIKILDKLILSISDMNKSIKEKSIKLIRIKKDIIIKNLEELGK